MYDTDLIPSISSVTTSGTTVSISCAITPISFPLKPWTSSNPSFQSKVTPFNHHYGYIGYEPIYEDTQKHRKYINEITPDVDFTFEYVSPFTGEKEALKVPIGVDFFYPAD